MTSTTEFQNDCDTTDVNPDAEQTFYRSTSVAPGVTLTLEIVGEMSTTDQGDRALQQLAETVRPSVADLYASRYVFTHQVQRTVTVEVLDDHYTATLAFQPTGRRDLRNGKSESSVLTALTVAVANAHSTIAERAMYAEAFANQPPVVLDLSVFVAQAPSRRRRMSRDR